MDMSKIWWVIISAVVAQMIAHKGYSKNSLSLDGAISAFFVGWMSFASSFSVGALLIAFFVSSSILTKYGGKEKAKIEDGHKEGGERTSVQVVSNSLPALLVAFIWLYVFGLEFCFQHMVTYPEITSFAKHLFFLPQPFIANLPEQFFCAVMAHYACVCGDTWASEMGSLSTELPRLITDLGRRVPKGTNGGISFKGLLWSTYGGMFIGFVAYCVTTISALYAFYIDGQSVFISTREGALIETILLTNLAYPALGAMYGLLGSLIDSLLGATCQQSILNKKTNKVVSEPEPKMLYDHTNTYEYICGSHQLDNHQVNLTSSFIVTVFAFALHYRLLF